jgi:hypothetical protein
MKAAHAQEKAEAAEASKAELNKALEQSRQASKLAEDATNVARQNEDALRAAAAASQRDRRLLDAARQSINQLSTCASAATDRGQAGGVSTDRTDGDRLMRLLAGLESAAGMHAEAAQRARGRGLLAEELYEVNRKACN